MENELQYDDSNIVVIEGSDAIRCRASKYLGELERADLFDDLIFEALCHAIDESLDDRCKHINIYIDRAGVITVEYDAGIPLHIANGLLTQLYACHNLKKHIEVGSEYCQIGLAVLNAVCSEFQVDIICNGKHGKQTYIKGKAEHDFAVFDSHEIDRTQFQFSFDEELLGKHEIHVDRLKVKAQELMQDFDLRVEIADNSGHYTN
jgi:DNA gyrase/topoisomerase IV subunit B